MRKFCGVEVGCVGVVKIGRAARYAVEMLEGRVLLSAGDLDSTFGAGGSVFLSDGSPAAFYKVQATQVQADGKIVLAGSAGLNSNSLTWNRFFLERLNVDGTVDTSFGSGGIVTTSFGGGMSTGTSLAIQGDGKIILGGSYLDGTSEFAIARYNANGSLDAGFGSGGKVLTHIPGSEVLGSIVLAPGGKIVATGNGTYQDPAHSTDIGYSAWVVDIARYNPDGSPDTTLNGVGYAYREVGLPVNPGFTAASGAVQGDGKILVGAAYLNDLAVWRFNVDGSMDTGFGLGGRAISPLAYFSGGYSMYGWVSRIAVGPDGRIVIASPVNDDDEVRSKWVLSRLNADGSVDTSFGNQGLVFPDVYHASEGVYPSVGGLVIQADGKIVMGGLDANFYNYAEFTVKRFLPSGAPDPTFVSQDLGFFSSSATGQDDAHVGAMAMSADGQVVIAGNYDNGVNPSLDAARYGIGVFRLQGDGEPVANPAVNPPELVNPSGNNPGDLDATFGFQGRTLLNDPSPVAVPDATTTRVKATAVLGNGKILLAGSIGTVADNGQDLFFLERLNSGGTLDTSFGIGGVVTTAVGSYSFATSILVQSDGKIVLGGGTTDSLKNVTNAMFALARFNADGSPDVTFGGGGKVVTDFAGNEEVDSLAQGPGGTIVAAGAYFLYPDVGFDVARYTPAGQLDTSFNSSGILSKDLGQSGSNSEPAAVGVQADGKVVVGSHQNDQAAVYRFNADGSSDGTFGTNGVGLTTGMDRHDLVQDGALHGSFTRVVIQPDGRILAGGAPASGGPPFVVARFDSGGGLDTTFGGTGGVLVWQSSNFSAQTYTLAGLLVQANGEIIVVGNQADPQNAGPNGPAAPLVRKLLPDGTVDPYFDTDQNAWFIPPGSGRGMVIEGAAMAPSGNVIVAADVWYDGTATSPHWLGVARYINNTDYFGVTKLANDGTSGSLSWALAGAQKVTPGAVIGFSPGLAGTIGVPSGGSGTVGGLNSAIWVKGPGAKQLTIGYTFGATGPLDVSGLTLIGSPNVSFILRSLTESVLHGAVTVNGLSQSPLTVVRSTLSGDGVWQTGISIPSFATALVTDSTITGYVDAGISAGSSNASIINCTIAGNVGLGLVGSDAFSKPKVLNTIVAGNGAKPWGDINVAGHFSSGGHNLIGVVGNSDGWVASDVTGTEAAPLDPMLYTLGDYGGPTPTMPPKPGSPAVVAGAADGLDQRGFSRLLGGNADIGSVQTSFLTVNGTAAADAFDMYLDDTIVYVVLNNVSRGINREDPLAFLTINGNGGTDSIRLLNYSGNQLPHVLTLNGTFTVTGLQGASPFAGSTIDLGQSTVYFDYSTGQNPAAVVRQALVTGYAGGAWNGSGAGATGAFVSSAAAARGVGKFALGYADSADGFVAGQPVNTVEVRFTYAGDANLDGVVNMTDAVRMQANYGAARDPAWDRGNFDYDAGVGSADAILLARNYGSPPVGGTVVAAAGVTAGGTTAGGTSGGNSGAAVDSPDALTPVGADRRKVKKHVGRREGRH